MAFIINIINLNAPTMMIFLKLFIKTFYLKLFYKLILATIKPKKIKIDHERYQNTYVNYIINDDNFLRKLKKLIIFIEYLKNRRLVI